jgi:sigma-B regulation protein RsbU (phosphoserine phosphatase)
MWDWQRSVGRLEIAAVLFFIGWRLLLGWMPTSLLAQLAGVVFLILAFWTAARWTRRLLRVAIWKLRNRLLLSYVFIAVVPVLLLSVLGVFGAWALAGQVAVYMVTQEHQQNLESLKAAGAAILGAPADNRRTEAPRPLSFLATRFPGIQVYATDGSAVILRHPADTPLKHPEGERQEILSTVMKDGRLYSGVHLRGAGGREVSLLVPITRRYLQELIPNLGEITLIGPGRMRADEKVELHEDMESDLSNFLSTRALAPAVNWLDFRILWGLQLPLARWDRDANDGTVLLGVHTRISQVFRVIFSRQADWDQPMLIYAFYFVAFSFLLVELISLFVGLSITRTITSAVHYLYESTERVAAGDFTYRIPIKGKDQLADLGRSYNLMIENLDRLLKIAKEKERLQADLDIAREVQEQLYPRSIPQARGIAFCAKLLPARSVSGDYYDYQRINDHQVAIAIGDVAGKGISAALLMANIQSAMRAQLLSFQESPEGVSTAAIVSQINKHLQANTTPEKYSTFYFSIYNEQTRELISTNAGHLPPILIRGGEVTRLDVNGMVVGVFQLAKYDASRIVLEPGDLLLLYTDGITEPENEYGEMFGEDRLIETVQKCADKSNEEILCEVFQAVRHWTYAPESADDMTMVIVRGVA